MYIYTKFSESVVWVPGAYNKWQWNCFKYSEVLTSTNIFCPCNNILFILCHHWCFFLMYIMSQPWLNCVMRVQYFNTLCYYSYRVISDITAPYTTFLHNIEGFYRRNDLIKIWLLFYTTTTKGLGVKSTAHHSILKYIHSYKDELSFIDVKTWFKCHPFS